MSFTPQSVFLKQQLDHVLNLAFQETFPALKARNFIPVNRSIPPAAETVSARIWDTYGEAKVLNPNADDFPSVSVGQREAFAPVKSLGCFFEYSVMELRRSELAGTGLDAKLATAARQTIESKIDKLKDWIWCALKFRPSSPMVLIGAFWQAILNRQYTFRPSMKLTPSPVKSASSPTLPLVLAQQVPSMKSKFGEPLHFKERVKKWLMPLINTIQKIIR